VDSSREPAPMRKDRPPANFIGLLSGNLTAGYTKASDPYNNYTANNLSPVEMIPNTQIHELGHSLDLIVNKKSSEASANKFADCVTNVK
jgi:hypothetical protein